MIWDDWTEINENDDGTLYMAWVDDEDEANEKLCSLNDDLVHRIAEENPWEGVPKEEPPAEADLKFTENEKTLTDGIFVFFADRKTAKAFKSFIRRSLGEMVPEGSPEGLECAINFMLLNYHLYDFGKKTKKADVSRELDRAYEFLSRTLSNLTDDFTSDLLEDIEGCSSKEILPFIEGSIRTPHMSEADSIIRAYVRRSIEQLKEITIREILEYDKKSREILRFAWKGSVKLLEVQVKDKGRGKGSGSQKIRDFLSVYKRPRDIVDYFDKHAAGQKAAKKAVALSFHKHLKRAVNGLRESPSKRSLILYGPTGSGKTMLWELLREISPVPIYIYSMSEFTQNGYKGADLGPILEECIKDPYCVIVFDECDKACMLTETDRLEGSKNAVQSLLLKPLDGEGVIGDKNKMIDTSNVLFAFCGAFFHTDSSSERRVVGFSQSTEGKRKKKDQDRKKLIADRDRIVELGMMPELAGRIRRWVRMEKFGKSDYVRIAEIYLKDWCMEQQDGYGVNVEFTEEALSEAADLVIKEGVHLGARGMINLLTTIAEDKWYDEDDEQERIVVTVEDVA